MEQRSEQWYRSRIGKLTASRAAPLMLGGPVSWNRLLQELRHEKKNADAVVAELMSVGTVKPRPMQHGIDWEQAMVAQYELATGFCVEPVGFLECPDFPADVGASPDWLLPDRVGEGKVRVSTDEHRRCILYGVPPDHYVQIHMQMWSAGKDRADYVSYCPAYPDVQDRLYIQTVELDRDYMGKLKAAVAEFLDVLKSGGTYAVAWEESDDVPKFF